MVSIKGNFKLQFDRDEETNYFSLKVGNLNNTKNSNMNTEMIDYDRIPLKALSEEEGKRI